MQADKPLILASSSPRRKQLLEEAGLTFTVDPSNYDEEPLMKKYEVISKNDRMTPHELALALSFEKAKERAPHYPNSIILAADTLGFLNGRILGKATNAREAKEIISCLSGRTHSVITGYCIIFPARSKSPESKPDTKKPRVSNDAPPFKGELSRLPSGLRGSKGNSAMGHIISNVVESLVTFRKLTEEEIDAYIATNEWKDKSCCYAIQGHASKLIEKYEGSLENIVGLPIQEVVQDLININIQSAT